MERFLKRIQPRSNLRKESTPELNRSQYSLISCTELTPGVVQVWKELPEEVKYDPALEQFRQLYEKEYGPSLPSKDGGKNGNAGHPPQYNHNQPSEDVLVKMADPPMTKKETMDAEAAEKRQNRSKVAKAGYLVKMTLLLACWAYFTICFLLYHETEPETLGTYVNPGELKHHLLLDGTSKLLLNLKVRGPFLSENAQDLLDDDQLLAATKFDVWLQAQPQNGSGYVEQSPIWSLVLDEEDHLDFSHGEEREEILRLIVTNVSSTFYLVMRTGSNATVPVSMTYTLNPLEVSTAVLISTAALATLAITGERPTLEEVISWLDVETLLLLFSMMVLVAIMAETGMFDYLAVFTFEVTKGKLWPLITLLCAITAVLSTVLDNVTTVLLITPVTIRLCEVMDLDPIPILMSMVLFSNIGGTATPVGDPPNVIIASNKDVIHAGVNFANFTLHMTVGVLIVAVVSYVQLRIMFRDTEKMRICVPRDIQDIRNQISIWKRAGESLPHLSKDVHVVKERLDRKVLKLSTKLKIMEKEAKKRACPKETFQSTLVEMKGKYKIRDKNLLIKSTIAVGFVVILFFLHSLPQLHVSLGWVALLGAILLLILADREDLEPILHRVEWSTLLFFAALFVLMEVLSKLGLIEYIGGLTESLILTVDESARLAVALLLILWVSGIVSAFVDNIPLTTMMVRVVISLGSNPRLNLPMMPLIWALSFGACLGGNGTLIGASANVVCAGVAEQHGYKFTFNQFFKIGFPIMIGHLIVASAYLLVCHCAFEWH
ncbi:citrate transporter domain-containing protein [Phthorimaea operculella]|nr:citrate transporter domain-containing protein [Phthorimaea operculella]